MSTNPSIGMDAELTTEASTRVLRRGDANYDAQRAGFNVVIEHHPDAIVEATSPADVVAAVRLATGSGRPVAVMNTGHGPSVPADGAVLVRTGRMNRVDVDPVTRTARVEAGAAWGEVIEAASPHGLAPLNGTSPRSPASHQSHIRPGQRVPGQLQHPTCRLSWL